MSIDQAPCNAGEKLPNKWLFRLWRAALMRLKQAWREQENEKIREKVERVPSLIRPMKLSVDVLLRSERHLTKNPKNSLERIRLIQHYCLYRKTDVEAARRLSHHVKAFVANNPLDENIPLLPVNSGEAELYEAVQNIWLGHIERDPGNLEILKAASMFYAWRDPALSAMIGKRVVELSPSQKEDIIRHCLGVMGTVETDIEYATNAYEALLLAYHKKTLSPRRRFEILMQLPEYAYKLGRFDDTIKYAGELLKEVEELPADSLQYGSNFHRACLWIARVLFERGDIKRAKQWFIWSVKTRPSLYLCTAGPDLYLAEQFVLAGERQIVINYLTHASLFWNEGILFDWIDQLKEGKKPDFSAYLI
ncbi:MAG: hypothetical protein KC652_02375 [Cyanobacteria bacterium HKST-UBA01]|nr:hypothetical protein [Cyanobacteria bacterium HKST-UBA01]